MKRYYLNDVKNLSFPPSQLGYFKLFFDLIKQINFSELDNANSYIEITKDHEPPDDLILHIKNIGNKNCEIRIEISLIYHTLFIGYDGNKMCEIMTFDDSSDYPYLLCKNLLSSLIVRKQIYSKRNKLLRDNYSIAKNERGSINYRISKWPLSVYNKTHFKITTYLPWIENGNI